LVMVVDARDPLFYRCPDLEAYALEVDQHKKTMLLVNKADLLPISIRKKWVEYFHKQGILFLFWSAKAASAALSASQVPTSSQEAGDADTKILGREELLARLQSAAEEIASTRNRSASHADEDLAADVQSRSVMVGFVGYPNVGKSSTINALVGEKRAGVTSTPGKTKHFQTLVISPKLTLCDCPGLVFPSFTSSRYEMIACGVLPIDRITEHREAVQVVANRVPRKIIEDVYNISLPKPKPYEPQSRPPTGAELLRAYCGSRGYVASSGLPDETRAARQILKDYVDGKLPHFEMPPGELDDEASEEEDEVAAEAADGPRLSGSDSSDDDDEEDEDENTILDHVLSDLSTFDMANGHASNEAARKKKPSTAPHKQHKKTQRKKDRSWRVQNGEGDGMPVVRVFRKAANTGPVNIR
ncbi:GTPase LSG1-2, partial [Datura stramonium]|nr:GTPase LSG1-2 [Datura stramonium]